MTSPDTCTLTVSRSPRAFRSTIIPELLARPSVENVGLTVTLWYEIPSGRGQPGPGVPPIEGVRARATVEDGALKLEHLEAAWSETRLTGSGDAPLSFLRPWLPAASPESRSVRRTLDIFELMLATREPLSVTAVIDF